MRCAIGGAQLVQKCRESRGRFQVHHVALAGEFVPFCMGPRRGDVVEGCPYGEFSRLFDPTIRSTRSAFTASSFESGAPLSAAVSACTGTLSLRNFAHTPLLVRRPSTTSGSIPEIRRVTISTATSQSLLPAASSSAGKDVGGERAQHRLVGDYLPHRDHVRQLRDDQPAVAPAEQRLDGRKLPKHSGSVRDLHLQGVSGRQRTGGLPPPAVDHGDRRTSIDVLRDLPPTAGVAHHTRDDEKGRPVLLAIHRR